MFSWVSFKINLLENVKREGEKKNAVLSMMGPRQAGTKLVPFLFKSLSWRTTGRMAERKTDDKDRDGGEDVGRAHV